MAITNYERVGKAMEILKQGLGPFIDREFKSLYKEQATSEATRFLGDDRQLSKKGSTNWTLQAYQNSCGKAGTMSSAAHSATRNAVS
jgi:hypothetical protein